MKTSAVKQYFTFLFSVVLLGCFLSICVLIEVSPIRKVYAAESTPVKILQEGVGFTGFPCRLSTDPSPPKDIDADEVTAYFDSRPSQSILTNTICAPNDRQGKDFLSTDLVNAATRGDYSENSSNFVRDYFTKIDGSEPDTVINKIGVKTTSGVCFPPWASSCYSIPSSQKNRISTDLKTQYKFTESGAGAKGLLCIDLARNVGVQNTVCEYSQPTTGSYTVDPQLNCLFGLTCYKKNNITPSPGQPTATNIPLPTLPQGISCLPNSKPEYRSDGECVQLGSQTTAYESCDSKFGNCTSGQVCCVKTLYSSTPSPMPFDPMAGEHMGRCNGIDLSGGLGGLLDNLPDDDGLISEFLKSTLQAINPGPAVEGIISGAIDLGNGLVGGKWPTQIRTDANKFKYLAGCSPNHYCASEMNIDEALRLPAGSIPKEDICIREDMWGEYLSFKMREYKQRIAKATQMSADGKPQNVAAPVNPIITSHPSPTPTPVLALDPVPLSRSLARLCFNSTQYGGRIAMAISNTKRCNFAGMFENFYEFMSFGALQFDSSTMPLCMDHVAYMETLFGRPLSEKQDALGELKRLCTLNNCDNIVNESTSTYDFVKKIPDESLIAMSVPASKTKLLKNNLSQCLKCAQNGEVSTAIGCIPVTNTGAFITKTVFQIGLGLAGSFSVLCIIYGAVLIQTAGANAKNVDQGRKIILQCLTGLIAIIFALFIFKFIGVDILRIPGLNI